MLKIAREVGPWVGCRERLFLPLARSVTFPFLSAFVLLRQKTGLAAQIRRALKGAGRIPTISIEGGLLQGGRILLNRGAEERKA